MLLVSLPVIDQALEGVQSFITLLFHPQLLEGATWLLPQDLDSCALELCRVDCN